MVFLTRTEGKKYDFSDLEREDIAKKVPFAIKIKSDMALFSFAIVAKWPLNFPKAAKKAMLLSRVENIMHFSGIRHEETGTS